MAVKSLVGPSYIFGAGLSYNPATGVVTATGGGGGGSGIALERDITQVSHGFAVQDVVRLNGTDTYTTSHTDTEANSEVVGMVTAVTDANNFKLTMYGYVASGLSGLTANTFYFVSPTVAGALTATAPSTPGQISKPVFYADTTSSGYVINYRGIEIPSGSGSGGTGSDGVLDGGDRYTGTGLLDGGLRY